MRDLSPLPTELTIYTVSDLRTRYLSEIGAAAHDAPLRLDASAVDSVDAAGIQLLLSLARSVAALGWPLQVVLASAPLTSACAALGVDSLLRAAEIQGASA